jgi:heparan-alpha-glucosaminide N-acetyltransferase
MSAANPQSVSLAPIQGRVASIDIFRGLTMMVMIFVNELAEVKGLPAWTYHMPAKVDAMTYVDMVFPIFLFIMGLSLPLAVQHRLKKNPSTSALWLHVLLRALALILIGLALANADKADPALMHLSQNAWVLITLTGAVLFWLDYGRAPRRPMLVHALRFGGLTAIVLMFAIFRRTARDGQVCWIDPSYPEILGLIGFTYLAICLLYLPTRRMVWAPFAWFVALLTLCALSTAHQLSFPNQLPLFVWPFGNGAMPCIAMAGVATSNLFLLPHRWSTLPRKMLAATAFALLAFAAGLLLTPLGISKIRATPTWSLYCIGAGILLFTALYWICDVKGRTAWAFFVKAAGSNTLMTYLLPDVFEFLTGLIGFTYLATHWSIGWPGVVKSVLFTLVVLALSTALTRRNVRLQL